MYGALLVILIASQGLTGADGTDDDYHMVDDARVQKMRVICGPNSLYLLLRAWNVPVRYTDVECELPMVERGTTLYALKETAAHFGLRTRVRKGTTELFKTLQLPSIVHLRAIFRVDGRGSHYALLYSISGNGISYVDGTTGLLEDVSWGKFGQYWTGYVVEPMPESRLFESPILQIPIFVANLVCVFLAARSPTVVGRLSRRARVMLFFGLLCCAPAFQARADREAPAAGDGNWRAPSYDAVNSLDLFLRLVGQPVRRERITSTLGMAGRQASLLDLKRAAQALGQPSRVANSSPGRLAEYPLPVIVHLFDERWQHGSFFVLFHINSDEYRVINGATATIEVLHTDEFRRRWSGHVLVTDNGSALWWPAAVIAVCCVTAAAWARTWKRWVQSRSPLVVSKPPPSPLVTPY